MIEYEHTIITLNNEGVIYIISEFKMYFTKDIYYTSANILHIWPPKEKTKNFWITTNNIIRRLSLTSFTLLSLWKQWVLSPMTANDACYNCN